jgi:hypothetical protein
VKGGRSSLRVGHWSHADTISRSKSSNAGKGSLPPNDSAGESHQ